MKSEVSFLLASTYKCTHCTQTYMLTHTQRERTETERMKMRKRDQDTIDNM